MTEKRFNIGKIPALLTNGEMKTIFIGVHGYMSCKDYYGNVAAIMEKHGCGLLTFDLPEHGERRTNGDKTLCKVMEVVPEILRVYEFATTLTSDIRLFAQSMGAYLSVSALQNVKLNQALFQCPLLDMHRTITDMMTTANVSPEMLKLKGTIPYEGSLPLYWDYYLYTLANKNEKWNVPTEMLIAENDEVVPRETQLDFAEKFGAGYEILPNTVHYVHEPEPIAYFEDWLDRKIK